MTPEAPWADLVALAERELELAREGRWEEATEASTDRLEAALALGAPPAAARPHLERLLELQQLDHRRAHRRACQHRAPARRHEPRPQPRCAATAAPLGTAPARPISAARSDPRVKTLKLPAATADRGSAFQGWSRVRSTDGPPPLPSRSLPSRAVRHHSAGARTQHLRRRPAPRGAAGQHRQRLHAWLPARGRGLPRRARRGDGLLGRPQRDRAHRLHDAGRSHRRRDARRRRHDRHRRRVGQARRQRARPAGRGPVAKTRNAILRSAMGVA